jgi:glycosyltransferase involved in cell wall biosynthesis
MTTSSTSQHAPCAAPELKIAYLCARYPAISHTFILREVQALRCLGAEVETFSIRRAESDQLLADADRVAFETTMAILPARWSTLLRSHLELAFRAPRSYAATSALALRLAPAGVRGHLWHYFYFVEAVLLWRECRRLRIRHIHVHLANVAADVALLATHIGSTLEPDAPWTWSFTMHGPTEFYDVSRYHLADKVRSAQFVVCISDYARSQMMALSPPELWENLHVVHVGVPIDQFTPSARPPIARDDATILLIGRQVPEKAQAILLEALKLLLARGHEVSLVLAGDGPSRPQLEGLSQRLGVGSRVTFPGAIGQDQIKGLYEGAQIFCLPSFAEGVPVVLMEAMAMGLPVVSTSIAGIPELIDNEHTGLLVPPGRPDMLADALEQLLIDPDLRCRLGSSAREKVIEDFNSQQSARQLYALFAQMLAQPSDQVEATP